jgi:hypothetical protein
MNSITKPDPQFAGFVEVIQTSDPSLYPYYVLLAVMEEEGVESHCDQVPDPNASYQGCTVMQTVYHPFRRPVFVMGLPEKSSAANAHVARDEALSKANEAKGALEELQTRFEALEKNFGGLSQELARMRDKRDQALQQIETLRGDTRALNDRIARYAAREEAAKKHWGEKTWAELGS